MAQWTTVRVSTETKTQLELLRQIWMEHSGEMKDPLGSPAVMSGKEAYYDHVGLDQVIRRLLLLHARKADRRRQAERKRRLMQRMIYGPTNPGTIDTPGSDN